LTRQNPPAPCPELSAIDVRLAEELIDAQFPRWSGLPLEPVEPGGSDHAIYRLGRELSVRLPRHAGAAGQAEKESRWLPFLAPYLPLAVPEPVAVGEPGSGYPWRWSVSRWLEGETATVEALADSAESARELARFLSALQLNTPDGVPERMVGEPLALRDEATRTAIGRTAGVFDARAMTELWEAALDAPAWSRPPVWFHGDFHTGNLLTVDGVLSAVIDFGELGVGDPAARDLMAAFTLLSPKSRKAFRAELGVDDHTWTRGRGWALATGLNAYASYAATDPGVAAQTTRQIEQALLG
jgi:aminoglycoside phosphotransferase (APT) family kinase protein